MYGMVTSQFWEARYSRRSTVRLIGSAGATAAMAVRRLDARAAPGAASDSTSSSIGNRISTENITMEKDTKLNRADQPTVVLVHGAFADSSSWEGVIEHLQEAGVTVTAASNPLRGVAYDSSYVASVLGQTEGPVLLVGHSYGGVVITNAGSQAPNVVGLVYVAGLAPDEGETLGALESDSRDSVLLPALNAAQFPINGGTETSTEFSIDPARIQDAFAADLPASRTAVMAATQRPIAEAAFSEPTGVPAWKSLPTWSIVPTSDKAAGSDVVRATAERAGATIVEIDASHVVMMSQPEEVANVILTALDAVA